MYKPKGKTKGKGKGKGFQGNCYGCGIKGHTKANCPKAGGKGKGKSKGEQTTYGKGGAWSGKAPSGTLIRIVCSPIKPVRNRLTLYNRHLRNRTTMALKHIDSCPERMSPEPLGLKETSSNSFYP